MKLISHFIDSLINYTNASLETNDLFLISKF